MRAEGVSARVSPQRVIDSNVKILFGEIFRAAVCATGIQVAGVLVGGLRRVKTGFESDDL